MRRLFPIVPASIRNYNPGQWSEATSQSALAYRLWLKQCKTAEAQNLELPDPLPRVVQHIAQQLPLVIPAERAAKLLLKATRPVAVRLRTDLTVEVLDLSPPQKFRFPVTRRSGD